ncbi:MAG: hypothetical protein N2039_07840, partial [Gemmataceae bacterium]|nr:hypothetical protein [Gemmataceae bacterium]
MSLRTTLLLLLLTAAGAFAWWRWDEVSSWVGIKEASASADAVGPRAVVPNLTPNSIQSVEV